MFEIEDWGLIDYGTAWQRQNDYAESIRMGKRTSVLAVCEHPSVITVGRSSRGRNQNIMADEGFLHSKGISVYNINRGGDVTLHNPGQLVGYPVFDLAFFKQDLHWFLREIEEVVIELLGNYGIESGRIDGLTGVWIESSRKICAIGLHCSRWITTHGFALNVGNALEEFSYIIPCGIYNKEVTSIVKEIGMDVDIENVKKLCFDIFRKRF